MATASASPIEETESQDVKPATLVARQRVIAYVVLFIAVAFSFVTLLPEATIHIPPLNDNVLHVLAAKQTAEAWSAGKNPTDPWLAPVGLGYPLAHHYQHLEYVPVAAIYILARHAISIQSIIEWSTVLLLALFPLSIYYSMRRFGFDYLAAAFGGMAAPLIATNALYGLDFSSYVWRGYGLYTQLWGMFLLPLALAAGYRLVRDGRGYALSALLLTVTMLCHTVYGYMAVISLAIITLLVAFDGGRAKFWSSLWQAGRRFVLLIVLTALAGSYFFVPFLLDGDYMNRSVWELSSKYNSYGASWVLKTTAKGDIFDYHRLPILTALVAVGLVVCLVRWREPRYRLPIVLFGAWTALYFGRPTWGVLLKALPLSSELHFHRLIGGEQLGGLLLIGVALAAPWPWLLRQKSVLPAVGAAFLCALILFPAFHDRANFLSYNATLMHRNQDEIAVEEPQLTALFTTLRSLPPGRVYAGLAGNWGKNYRVGDIPMYGLLQDQGFDMVGFLYHALSLNSDVEVLFNDQNQSEYNLFNVRYVVAPANHAFPSFVKPIGTFGTDVLYQVDTTGYFDLVASPLALTGNRGDFYPAASSWINGPEPGLKQEPQVVLDGSTPSTPSVPLTLASPVVSRPLSDAQGPQGTITDEQVGKLGSYAATVDVGAPTMVMVKVTYHPGWHVTIDGNTVEPVMLMPSFVGIPVPAGTHSVQLTYESGSLRDLLGIFGIVLLGLTAVAERRRGLIDRQIARMLSSGPATTVKGWIDEDRESSEPIPWLQTLRNHAPYLAVVAGVAFLAGLPLLQLKLMGGHDSLEYLPRSEEFYKLLSFGHWFPRWAPDLSGGRGQPFFNFNPPLIYYLISAFHFVGFSFIAAQDLALFLLLILSAGGMYLLASSFFGPRGGVISVAAYLFAPYFLVALYVRHALADYAAFAFLPFLVWGVVWFAERGGWHRLVIGAVALSLLTLSSNPVTLISFPALLVLVASIAYLRRNLVALARGAWCVGLGLGLSAFFWLPALVERKYVHLSRLLEGALRYENHFVYFRQLIYSKWGDGFSVPGTGDGMSFEVGPIHVILLLFVAATLFWELRAVKRVKLMLVVMGLWTVAAAYFSTNLSRPFWDQFSLLQYLEFPWRFMTLVAFASAFVAGGVGLLTRDRPRFATPLTVALVLLFVAFGISHAHPPKYQSVTDADYSPNVIAQRNLAVTTAQEYQPIWVQQQLTQPVSEPVSFAQGNGASVAIPGSTATDQRYLVNVTEPSSLRLNTDYFPGWRLKVNGAVTPINTSDPTGVISLVLQPGQYVVELAFHNTPVRTWSAILSWLTLLILILSVVGSLEGPWSGWGGYRRLVGWMTVEPDVVDEDENVELARDEKWQTTEPFPVITPDNGVVAGDVSPAGLDLASARSAVSRRVDMLRPIPRESGVAHFRVPFSLKAGIYLCFLALYLVITPGHFFSTDEVAVYLTTQSLATHQSLEIKPIFNTVAGRHGAYYGRYGLLQSVLSIPLYAMGAAANHIASPTTRALLAGPDLRDWGGTVPIFFVSLFNAFVTPLTCVLIFLFSLRFGYPRRVALAVTILFGVSTLAFTYASTYFQHALESFLVLLTVYLLFIQRDRPSLRSAVLAGLPLGLAILTRLNVALTVPVFALYVFLVSSQWDGHVNDERTEQLAPLRQLLRRVQRPFEGIPFADWWSITVTRCVVGFMIAPVTATMLFLALNEYRFGTVRDPGVRNISHGSLDIFVGLYGNLVSPGRSIFLYSPPLILALFGAWRFYQRFHAETLLIAGLVAVYLMLYSIPTDWDGGWSFGPRYLLALVPLLVLPLGEFLTSPWRWRVAVVIGLLGAGIQIVGSTVNVSYVYWDWLNMHLSPANAFLFSPSLSAIPTHTRDLFAGKHVDVWVIWVARNYGVSAMVGIIGMCLAILSVGLILASGEMGRRGASASTRTRQVAE
ncbi:MAG: YfhO family protein [Nitrolancea sp.]